MEYEIVDKDLNGFKGTAWLVRFEESVTVEGYSDTTETQYIAISPAVARFSGPETYIFPADEAGKVLSWAELPGSFRGDLDPQRALDNFLRLAGEDGVVSR